MKSLTKKIFLISGCCMGAGLLLTGAGVASGGWPGFALTRTGVLSASSREEPYTMEKTRLEEFSGIDLVIGSEADIEFLPSNDNSFYLEYTLYGQSGRQVYDISDDTLHFTYDIDNSVGVYFFGLGSGTRSGSPVIRIYVPENRQLSKVDIRSSFGDLLICDLSAKQADIRVDYGDLNMENADFNTGTLELSAGDLEISDSTIKTLSLTNEYGDCELTGMNVESAALTIDAGDLIFRADSLETLTGYNDYGDTSLTLPGQFVDYSFTLYTEYGEITVPEDAPGRLVSEDMMEMTYDSQGDGEKNIEFEASSGNIVVDTDTAVR